MYFPYFITYISIGLVISIVVFIWAIKNGQFKDQQRARFLPLEDDSDRSAAKTTRISRYEIYALFIRIDLFYFLCPMNKDPLL
jgi:cbb3-type cytochrome oxidase maturation protein